MFKMVSVKMILLLLKRTTEVIDRLSLEKYSLLPWNAGKKLRHPTQDLPNASLQQAPHARQSAEIPHLPN